VIPRGRRAATLTLALLACLAALACVSDAAPSTFPAPSLTPVPGGSSEVAGQTETAWGRIWNTLPPSFPVPEEAVEAQTSERGISGSFSVGASGETTATLAQAALQDSGYTLVSRTTLAADGVVVIEAVAVDPTCRVQVRVTPLSGTTRMAVLYGAGCPFE
jgi:hypothetical protein